MRTLPHLNHSPTTVPYRATGHVLGRHFMILRWLCCFRVSSVVCCVTNGSQDNLFEWHFTIRGPPDSPFANGLYHGRILLDSDYPFKPPNFMLLTVRSTSLPLQPDSAAAPETFGKRRRRRPAPSHGCRCASRTSCARGSQLYSTVRRGCASRDTSPAGIHACGPGGRLVLPRVI